MTTYQLSKPVLIMLAGFPGAGKSHFAKQLADELGLAYVDGERLRQELFSSPVGDSSENRVVRRVALYMTGELLKAGGSVVVDISAPTVKSRQVLRSLARKYKAEALLIWVQTDASTAYKRSQRAYRKLTGQGLDKTEFKRVCQLLESPKGEAMVAISGQHIFKTQQAKVIQKLMLMGLIPQPASLPQPIARRSRPKLGGRIDYPRRRLRQG